MTRLLTHHAVYGLDLGQTGDPSALTLLTAVESIHSPHTWYDPTHPRHRHWLLSDARIFPLGMAYRQLAQQIHAHMLAFLASHPQTPITLVADAPGLGRPPLEILHAELAPTAHLAGIVFTGGQSHSQSQHPTLPVTIEAIPKLDLIQNLIHSIESRQLHLTPGLPLRDELREQFRSLRYTNNTHTGHTGITVAPGSSHPHHADLVMALSLATWRLRHLFPQAPNPLPQRLPGF
ncbi:MAG: hypothetical protein ACK6DZ_24460 [Acidobacteriota bacterium]